MLNGIFLSANERKHKNSSRISHEQYNMLINSPQKKINHPFPTNEGTDDCTSIKTKTRK